MPQTTYETRGDAREEALIADLFALGGIGYVALDDGQRVLMREAPGLQTETTAQSNFFEELIVNPTLLALAHQRGALDCGGVDHIAIGYGGFTQLIFRKQSGHVSLGVARHAEARKIAARAKQVLAKHGQLAE